MPPNDSPRSAAIGSAVAVLLLVSACGGGGQASTQSSTAASPSTAAGASTAASAAASASTGPTGPAALDAPQEVSVGTEFQVAWTGPNAAKDYVTLVLASATKWTSEPYFYTTAGTPGKLVAPVVEGAYALWYVSGADATILTRKAIRVTPFVGTVKGPSQVEAGANFEAAWTGPNGPGDYVTIIAAGATQWTDESYFYTKAGSPGKLTSPISPGAYELWYVTGNSRAPQVRQPITVNPYVVTLQAPATVKAGAKFQVTWTGPNGPSDYITIVAAGAAAGSYLDYAYTASGNPVTIMAPAAPGNYEVRYASDRVKGITFKSIPIVVN